MNKLPLVSFCALLPLVVVGCSNVHAVKTKPTVTTGLTENRVARMEAIIDDLKFKGYSEDRAKRIAAKQVPLIETTHRESISDVVTGAATKKKAKQDQFAKDLAKSVRDN